GTWLAWLCTTETASALRGSNGQRSHRTTLEHLAHLVRDLAGRVVERHRNRCGGDILAPDFDGCHLRLDVQQHQRQSLNCDACAPRTQSGREFYTNACGRRPATSHDCASLFCCRADRLLQNGCSNASSRPQQAWANFRLTANKKEPDYFLFADKP